MGIIRRIFFSTRTMGVLLILYALAMADATFVENDYGTSVAKELIYHSWWFEAIMVSLVANFLGNISRYKLYRRSKWPLLVFHLAFFFMFAGGAITRYISYDGNMHIREGDSENKIISEGTFLTVQIAGSAAVQNYPAKPATFISDNSPAFFRMLHPHFSATYAFEGEKIGVRVLTFIPRALDSIRAAENAPTVLHLVATEDGARKDIFIASGTSQQISGVAVGFNTSVIDGVCITDTAGQLQITSALPARYMVMATQTTGSLKTVGIPEPLHLRALYNLTMGPTFVVPDAPRPGQIVHYEGDLKKDALAPDLAVLEVRSGKHADTVAIYGGKGLTGFQGTANLKDIRVALGYGSRYYYTPFQVHLNRFELQKYPGSTAPSSYASEVTVSDAHGQMPYRIYMNHILDYQGFRFFQSSYDADEKGTILSVNHDVSGTCITYIGYAMLFAGMFFTLLWKGTRFSLLRQQLKTIARQRSVAVLLLLLLTTPSSFGQHSLRNQVMTDSAAAQFARTITIDKQHATDFGYLPVQNFDGRIEPVNTLGLEILRKLYHHDSYYSLDANQFLLAITTQPLDWLYAPLISINKRGGTELLKQTKANKDGITSVMNLLQVDDSGNAHFILEKQYNISFARKAARQDNYDKEVIELNDKMEVIQMLLSGMYLRIIPIAGDPNHTWASVNLPDSSGTKEQALIRSYYASVISSRQSGDWHRPDQLLQAIKQLQQTTGTAVMPPAAKLQWEVRFNSWNLFFKLMLFYSVIGGLLLVTSFIRLFRESRPMKYITLSLISLLTGAAAVQAFGLGVRWYISGHAPWSSGYEAVMFISLVGLVSGLLLYRNSNALIPAAGALIAVILMGFAHGGAQMNPQITPLVPVLKSYWLMIHVAIITASYGFFGLSALLGMMVLLLHIFNHKNRQLQIDSSIRELTIVNELSMIIGIFMLTCGTFLGGMWANESWGRYWSWDPKETWAFISVIVYAFVLHARLIPGIGSKFLFNFLSLVSFSSVIMTYFGVNYYLSGLHSYAKGDPMPIPAWVYITIGIVAVVSIAAWLRYKALRKRVEESL